ncbi:MAG: 2-succinylbenzoate--CoA ligase [Chroococcopsis gigantea SAG 12.99]|jgi:acyl-CoA synthetase (AMP-forming)/AMP-acid ligase II/thioesterase domain-containing protein/acyl carrier protein|nr:AMP-binding protein [Chlorogloea purpurea SAG 13.99]MDV3002179.1 2-succinylbenzoate--CoA ligase [Chroococcopsis gigantea SAG 12.99]
MAQVAIAHGEPFIKNEFDSPRSIPLYLSEAVESLKEGQLVCLQMDEHDTIVRTYSQLWSSACSLLGGLRESEVSPGRVVVVILDRCDDFVTVLWSCLLGGFVPIPLRFSINHTKINEVQLKLKTVLDVVDDPLIITSVDIEESWQKNEILNESLTILKIENLKNAPVDEQFHQGQPEDLCALFFSSGTTGKPKLVGFTCGAILNRLLELRSHQPENIVSLYWLPLDHASANLRMVNPDARKKIFLPTEVFLVDPLRWLDAIEKYGINKTSITNFGMTLINRCLESGTGRHWDLSALKNLGIGAETISPQTYQTFLNGLTPRGLNPEAIFTGYGLTECGTVVGGKAKLITLPNSDKQYMQLGKPCRGYSIRVVDERGYLLGENEIGHIEVKGISTTKAYYNRQEETGNLFSGDGWIKTGDLGFLQDANLVITGRDKDIIIINAKNYSCGEIEEVINCTGGIDISAVVACGIPNANSGSEDLVIFFSQNGTDADIDIIPQNQRIITLIKKLRLVLITQLNINAVHIIPINPNCIPRTSFGKIQRNILTQKFQAGEFEHLIKSLREIEREQLQADYIAPKTDTEKVIAQIWCDVLGESKIGVENNFFDLGGQSILAAGVIARIENQLGINLPLYILFQHPTITELSFYIDSRGFKSVKDTSVIAIKPDGTRTPLYFINDTGFARTIATLVDLEQPVYSLNIFGLTTRIATPFNQLQIKDFAEYIIEDLQKIQPRGPYQFVGFCQNGALTLEIAQQLVHQGNAVSLVCLIDVIFKVQKLNSWQRLKVLTQSQWLSLKYKIIHYIDAKIIRKSKIENQSITEIEAAENIIEKINSDKNLYEAYLKAQSQYIPSVYNGKIVSFQSIEWSYKDQSKLMAISQRGLKSYQIRTIHDYLFKEPFVHILVKNLSKHLN